MPNIYKVQRLDKVGYDEYDAFIVSVNSDVEASAFHPSGDEEAPYSLYPTWNKSHLEITKIGLTDLPFGTIILASFNAG